MKIDIITNPAKDIFIELVRNSKEQLFASPFVKTNIASLIIENKPQGSKMSLLTNYKLSSFYRNSSDINALRCFIDNNIRVRNYSRLHAKTYIFDDNKAIITSGNLTSGGLKNNYECGIFIQDNETVSKLKFDYLRIFSDNDFGSEITSEILKTTESILSKVPREKRVLFEKTEKEILDEGKIESEADLFDGGIEAVSKTLKGWTLDTFNIVLGIESDIFTSKQVYAYTTELQKKYPNNNTIEDQLRKQLQKLRDIGLLEFLGSGKYRKLWKNI